MPGRSRLAAALAALGAVGALAACNANGDDVPAPAIAAIVPASAPAGATVTVEGDHFCPTTGDSDAGDPGLPCTTASGEVTFGPATATPTRWTSQSIDVVVPAGLDGTVPVLVIVAGRSSNQATFSIAPP